MIPAKTKMTSSQGEEVILYETHQEGLEPSTYRLLACCFLAEIG